MKIIDDTLKKKEHGILRYSRTSLTMFTAWVSVLITFFLDFFAHGLRIETWTILFMAAMGQKVLNAWTSKIETTTAKTTTMHTEETT